MPCATLSANAPTPPPPPVCTPVWRCNTPLDGFENDGCGNNRYNPACAPLPPVVSIIIMKVAWYDRPDGTPGIRIDFNATADKKCSFEYETIVDGRSVGTESIPNMELGTWSYYTVAWSDSDPLTDHTVCLEVITTSVR